MVRPALLVTSMVLLVGGCASGDPNQGGFFGGLFGLGSGTYEKRIADKTETWSTDDRRYQEEVAAKDRLDATVRDRHHRVTDLEQRVAEIESDTATLNTEIATLLAAEKVTSGELADAEGKVASLLDDIDALNVDQQAAGSPDVNETGFDGNQESNRPAELRSHITELAKTIETLNSSRRGNEEKTPPEVSRAVD